MSTSGPNEFESGSLGPQSWTGAPDELGDLEDAFNFTGDDIDHNSAGHLSDHQRRQLLAREAKLLLGTAVCLIVAVLFVIGGVSRAVGSAIGVAGTFGSLALYGCYRLHATALDLLENEVHQVSGPLRGHARDRKFYIEVGDQSFRISDELFRKLELYGFLDNGSTYRVFYVPNSARIVSVEQAEARPQPARPDSA